jgi:hypothetical protein
MPQCSVIGIYLIEDGWPAGYNLVGMASIEYVLTTM